jgi:hypothetical protein
MSDGQIEGFEGWAKAVEANGLPQIILPGSGVTISACAEKLFKLIAPTKKLFMRGGAVMVMVKRDDGLLALEILRTGAARSLFEKFARLFAWRSGADGRPVLKPVTCAQEMAEALLQREEAVSQLPHVEGLINCPMIREADGKLVVSRPGYDDKSRIVVTGGKTPPVISLAKAVAALLDLFMEFDFQSPADKARAMASLISPALKIGGFLKGRVPADVAEADQSQSGKTYRQKLIAAVYNERLSLVTCKAGGVGSIDESLSQQLIGGHPRTNETRHDFRDWVQVCDWIVRNIFGLVAIMDGHEQAQVRVSDPALVWLRRLVLAANEVAQLNQGMTATGIYALCQEAGIEIPGLRTGSDEDRGKKVIGSVIGKLFGDRDTVEVDGFTVTREETYKARGESSSGGGFMSKIYTITRTSA